MISCQDHSGAGTATFTMHNEEGHTIFLYRESALTGKDLTPIDATYGSVEEAVLNNVRTRLNELETRLKNIGLLA